VCVCVCASSRECETTRGQPSARECERILARDVASQQVNERGRASVNEFWKARESASKRVTEFYRVPSAR